LSGRLLVVSTPIGNLADITLRALRVLGEADVVAAEDTRSARKLLTHHGIRTPLVSYHRDNERARTPELLARLRDGQQVALVSEAGTPSISDPGERLVRAAIDAGVPVEQIPGPSALIAALVVSGVGAGSFVFDGFLPRRATERRRRLESMRAEVRTLVFFEAPHRLDACLSDLLDVLGDRRAAICRELTKLHEETRRGTLSEIIASLATSPAKGEIVLVVEGSTQSSSGDLNSAADEVERLVGEGMSLRDASADVASVHALAKRALYDRVLERRRADA
jgi:16S rRNA (cytidine1402-2'-O)-methyltransferase